jgi:hypothetical protein
METQEIKQIKKGDLSLIDEEEKERKETGSTTSQVVAKLSNRNLEKVARLDALLKREETHY